MNSWARLQGRSGTLFHEGTTRAMDASLYFRLTDQIDGAASLEELATIVAEIERTQPHMIERRALERRLNRRERTLSGAAV
jgi:hypothetical protein